MKKIKCAACGLINLDRFVTYPHCAGCGTLLPHASAARAGGFWRRSLAAPWWVGLVALFCIGLGASVVNVASDSGRREDAPLLVYAQVPRVAFVGRTVSTLFNIDTVEDPGPSSFSDVRLRLSREVLSNFTVSSVSPPPAAVMNISGGRYFLFGTMDRSVPIRVRLSARRLGEVRFTAQIYVREYDPFDCRAFIEVLPPPSVPGGSHHVKQ